jgi:tetratricopeptide (TPR) repeat protein
MFGPAAWEDAEVDARQLREVPERLRLGDEEYVGRRVQFDGDRLDISAILGGHDRQDTVLLFGELHAERAMEIPIGAAADWWMAWWINGEPAYDTLEAGNAGQDFSVGAHTFRVPLRAGANMVAVRVSGGREGFLLVAGIPPAERWDPLLRATREEQRRSELSSLIADAVSAEEAGERAGARALLGEALEFAEPGGHVALSVRLRIGESHERDGNHENAREVYAELLSAELPSWARPVVQARLAQALEAAGEFAEARDAYLRLTRMRDTHPHTISGAHLGLAGCLLELGHPQLAARQYERVLRMEDARPDHAARARRALAELAGG